MYGVKRFAAGRETNTKRRRVITRVVIGAVVGASTLALGVVGLAAPASAHTIGEAVANGCGSSYNYLTSKPMRGGGGSLVGYVVIARVPATQRFCGLTVKIASHGSATDTYVCISRRGDVLRSCDRGNYGHFANRTAFDGQHRCVIAAGRFKTTNGVWASNETAALYANGASCA